MINGNLNERTVLRKRIDFSNISVPAGGTNKVWVPASGRDIEGYTFMGGIVYFTSTSVEVITASVCPYSNGICLVFTSNHTYTLSCSGLVVLNYIKNDLVTTLT